MKKEHALLLQAAEQLDDSAQWCLCSARLYERGGGKKETEAFCRNTAKQRRRLSTRIRNFLKKGDL